MYLPHLGTLDPQRIVVPTAKKAVNIMQQESHIINKTMNF